MNDYENLISFAYSNGINVLESDLGVDKPFGKCIGNLIIINNRVNERERLCVLYEELAHFELTVGDITNQNNSNNKKQELMARIWSYSKMVNPETIIKYILSGINSIHDLSEKLHVTEEILIECIKYYKRKYGVYYVGETHLLIFEPLNIMEYPPKNFY